MKTEHQVRNNELKAFETHFHAVLNTYSLRIDEDLESWANKYSEKAKTFEPLLPTGDITVQTFKDLEAEYKRKFYADLFRMRTLQEAENETKLQTFD